MIEACAWPWVCTCSKHQPRVTFGQLDCWIVWVLFLSDRDVFVSTASTHDWWQGAPALLLPLSAAWFRKTSVVKRSFQRQWPQFSGMAKADRARDRWLQILLKATLPSLQSTKVPPEPILITENEGENFFPHFARNDQRYAPLSCCLRQRHPSDLSAAPSLGSFRRPCM